MIPLVIFDMDGVLLDSEPVHFQLEREIFSTLGLVIPESEHYGYVGMSPRGMWTAIKEGHRLHEDIDALVELEASAKLRKFGGLELQPMAGVEDLIQRLTAGGHELAIASSSSRRLIETVVSKLGLDGHFSHRISAEDVEYGKPNPGIFLKVAELCAREPGECVVIEDSANGLRAASAAGMAAIGYANANSGNQDLSEAKLVVDDFGDASIRRIMSFIGEARN